jgi:ABC-2 type transport system permease protein
MLRVATAFIRRDFLIFTSYRMAFAWQFVTMIGGTIALSFVGVIAQGSMGDVLAPYGASYFAFILVGFGFLQFLGAASSACNDAVREGQTTGTLEVILTSPHRIPTILLGSSGFYILYGMMRLLLVFAAGHLLFKLWGQINYGAALGTLLICAVCFSAIGLIGSAFTLAFKRGDPVLGIYGLLNAALGGLIFPVQLLPSWLRPFAALLPLTHALEAMRLALNNASLAAIIPSWAALLLLSAVLLPSGGALFWLAYNYARDRGSLVQY